MISAAWVLKRPRLRMIRNSGITSVMCGNICVESRMIPIRKRPRKRMRAIA